MKQDKLMLSIQIFFRFLAWSAIPGAIVWLVLALSFFSTNNLLLNRLFQTRHLGLIPSPIPFSFFLLSSIFLVGSTIGFFLYHQIAGLIKKIRQESEHQEIIQCLRRLSYFFVVSFVLDFGIFLLIQSYFLQLKVFLDALTLIRPVIDWYHFIYVEFTGITGVAVFLIIRLLIRFMEYHFKLRKDLTDLKDEQELVI